MESMREKIQKLRELLPGMQGRDHSFAKSLIDYFDRKGGLTPRQAPYVDTLITNTTSGPDLEPENEAAVIILVHQLATLFEKAKLNGIQFPRIVFETSTLDRVMLIAAGSSSKYPGSINVKINGEWVGRIDKFGKLIQRGDYPISDEIIESFHEIGENPSKAGKVQGQKTGRCMFCSRGLVTTDSVYFGYGPICAEKWGLEWGTAKEHIREDKLHEAVNQMKNLT